ncbi:cytochrome P450 724B1-like [Impatiens glandulifera]|uniref:cytochrome P450 724B1-like n=1 Tax=Impatiens glandulifera TaxID=253017 RepID=UPI001FB15F2A|nr:cytochrome P450 724B1-like [Impatiens glandulifera]
MAMIWFVVMLLVGYQLCRLIIKHYLPMFIKSADGLYAPPKGSFGWPLLGETLSFLKPHPSNTMGSFLLHHCSKYGKVFKSHLFLSPTVVSCDQELNNFLLQNEDIQCSYPKPIYGILGNMSMLVTVGDIHKRLRKVAFSLVHTIKSNPEFLTDIERAALRTLDSWKDRKTLLFCKESRQFTFNVIVKQVLGLTPDEPETVNILKDFLTFMKGLISLPLYIPGTSYAKAVKARIRISCKVKSIIEERKRMRSSSSSSSRNGGLKEEEEESMVKSNGDFLEILLGVDTLSEDEKVSFVLDSLLGGYETTSVLLAMVVYFLSKNPSSLHQLKEEHESIRSKKKEDDLLNWDDFKRMDFTQKVINETLRLGNVVKFVHRKALKDIKYKGYLIPAGWKVLPVLSAVHLDPSIHINALEFHPWRWENQDQTSKKFIPFGGGSRCCPGSDLGRVEVAFFLHHLIRKFRWKVEDGVKPLAFPYVDFEKGMTMTVEQCSI